MLSTGQANATVRVRATAHARRVRCRPCDGGRVVNHARDCIGTELSSAQITRMSPAVIALIAVLTIAVVVIVVLVIRMNREPVATRDESGVLPLFTSHGVMNEGEAPEGYEEFDEDEAAERAALQRDVARHESAQREATQRESDQRDAAQREALEFAASVREAAAREAAQRAAAQRAAATAAAAAAAAATGPAASAAATPGSGTSAGTSAASISPDELARLRAAASAAPNGAPRTPPPPASTRPQAPPSVRTFNTATPLRQAPPVANPSPAPSPSAIPPARTGDTESTINFNIPNDGTLQFLPGRLEVASGRDSGREIRFVRLPGPNGGEFTFGRSEGELYRHIQLRDQTVSRAHAKMRFAEGRWMLQNLSQTNPVVHDGRPLATGEELPLEDGARIEMGEVLFAFKNR